MRGGGGSSVRRRWIDDVLDGAFALGVLAGLGYAAAVIAYALVTRWIGGVRRWAFMNRLRRGYRPGQPGPTWSRWRRLSANNAATSCTWTTRCRRWAGISATTIASGTGRRTTATRC